jgi:hypothetical protein
MPLLPEASSSGVRGRSSKAEAQAMCHVLDPKAITTYKEYQAALASSTS